MPSDLAVAASTVVLLSKAGVVAISHSEGRRLDSAGRHVSQPVTSWGAGVLLQYRTVGEPSGQPCCFCRHFTIGCWPFDDAFAGICLALASRWMRVSTLYHFAGRSGPQEFLQTLRRLANQISGRQFRDIVDAQYRLVTRKPWPRHLRLCFVILGAASDLALGREVPRFMDVLAQWPAANAHGEP